MSDKAAMLSWPDWIYELCDRLRLIAGDTPMFLVGGAVRDAYLRATITDIDIAVDGNAPELAKQVSKCLGADSYVMDWDRGVARVFLKSDSEIILLDFARFRGDGLLSDLRDRDFTMNAMAADLHGDISALYDPLNGVSDLRQKVLRRCSPRSIADDPIRALRAVRQSVQFALKIHPDTAADVRSQAQGMRRTSPERIRDELFRLLALDKPARGLRVMGHLGVLRHAIPQLAELARADASMPGPMHAWTNSLAVVERMRTILSAISSRRTDNTAAAFDLGILVMQLDRYRENLQAHLAHVYGNGREHGELLVLAAAIHLLDGSGASASRGSASGGQAAMVAKALALTLDEQRRLSLIIGNYKQIVDKRSWSTLDLHRFWHRLGARGIDAILLAAACVLGEERSDLRQADWLQFVDRATLLLDTFFIKYEEVVDPQPLLNGRDVQDLLGIGPGPLVGRVLTNLCEAQATGVIKSVSEAREFVLRSIE